MNPQNSFLKLFDSLHGNEAQRGKQFERACKWFLQNDPEYRRELKRVWLWDEWPGRWGRDKGIDLVAEDFDGKIWAVQAKAYAPQYSITKQDVDKFLSESSRKIISYRLLIATAAELGHNAREAIEGQEKQVGYLLLSDLKKRNLRWPSSPDALFAKQPKPRKPRPDQTKAINDVVRNFRTHNRGQLIRACGTGKTLIGLRVAEAMKAKRVLVLVPSLSLVSQILDDWTSDAIRPFRFLPVCSDDTVRGEDHLVTHTSELGLPATTNPADVAKFLKGSGPRVIFSTYQSTPVIAAACKRYRLPPFDLAIADEAHRCAGLQTGPFASILHSHLIPARKRLFMTATPRYLAEAAKSQADEMGLDVASMDDHKVFGPVFHELKFSEAIHRKLLTDYKVVIIGVDDPIYRQYAKDGRFVTPDGKRITDARTLSSHIAVAKAAKQYDLRRIITFHGRVSRAAEFAKEFPDFVRWMPKQSRPTGEFWAKLISGSMSSSKRDAILDQLRGIEPPQRGLVSNARCLGEGVDVRALDGVAFIDPKESQVDIIQAIGRAIRKADNKKLGVIILPVYISSDEDEEKVLADSAFKQVWRVLRALRAHDNRLADELDNIRTKIGQGKRVRTYFPHKITLNLPERLSTKFVDSIYLRTVRSITPPPRLTIEQILVWADKHMRRTGNWPDLNSGLIPENPDETWVRINGALSKGLRGLSGGSSLAKLLAEFRNVPNRSDLPELTIAQILLWSDQHRQRTGDWPHRESGKVSNVANETWSAINSSLVTGSRELPGGSSLARLLAKYRGARNPQGLPKLTIQQILMWAGIHHKRTGRWPHAHSGKIKDAPGETWIGVDRALALGTRGLPKGLSIAKLLAKNRNKRNPKALPNLTVGQILKWADAHHRRTGKWPTGESGLVLDSTGDTWKGILLALYRGRRGLPGNSSLAKLLAAHRGVRNRAELPNLTVNKIQKWADKYHRRTGGWPDLHTGEVSDSPGETWAIIDRALRIGFRGLSGGSSLAKIVSEHSGVRYRQRLSDLTYDQILKWVDKHRQRTGEWPDFRSGNIVGASGEKWSGVNRALLRGSRGLPKGSSLAKLLASHRNARNLTNLPQLSPNTILEWGDKHYRLTGKWPGQGSGKVIDHPDENWLAINAALTKGNRGLPGGSSLASLFALYRNARNKADLPNLSINQILLWSDLHYNRTGQWPNIESGKIIDASGETWSAINASLRDGRRGLSGGLSLAQLLDIKRRNNGVIKGSP